MTKEACVGLFKRADYGGKVSFLERIRANEYVETSGGERVACAVPQSVVFTSNRSQDE